MRIVTYACDGCGHELETERCAISVWASSLPLPAWPSVDPETGQPRLDLCGPCMSDLAAWIQSRWMKKTGGKPSGGLPSLN